MNSKYDPLEGRIAPVFFHYAIPSVFGMLAISSAVIVDGIFLGNYVGASALAAVNLSVPVISLLYAIVFMLAVGGSVMCGKHLGAGDTQQASSIFTKTLLSALAGSVAVCLPGLIFIEGLIKGLGANASLSLMVEDYLAIIFWFGPLFCLGYTLFYFVRLDGRPMYASVALALSALVNILLDWLFIVEMDAGIKGAAWATGIAQGLIFLFLLPHFLSPSSHLEWLNSRKGWGDMLRASANGFSEFTNELSAGVMILLFNWVIIHRLGVDGVAAFTIVEYVLFVSVMIAYGISESLQPTISKNLGARQTEKISGFLMVASKSWLMVGLFFCGLLIVFPDALISVFLKDSELQTQAIAREFIYFFWPVFLFNGLNIVLSSYFTTVQKPLHSAAIAISRSLLLPVFCLLLLSSWLGDIGVYIAVPIAECLTFILAIWLYTKNRPATLITSDYQN